VPIDSGGEMVAPLSFVGKELLDLVWSKPMRDVAKLRRVYDVAIGKACRQANIPRPIQGYWNQPEGTRPPAPKSPEASRHGRYDTDAYSRVLKL